MASSLYYLHLNSEDDVRLLEDDQNVVPAEPESTVLTQRQLPRKPLPESPRPSLDVNRQSLSILEVPESLPISAGISQGCRRKPPAGEDSTLSEVHPVQVKESISRRPLGARPIISEPTVNRKPLPGLENVPPSSRLLSQGSNSPTRVNMETKRDSRSSFSKYGEVEDSFTGSNSFYITFIRRDPSSGVQWNIGTIDGHPAPDRGADQGNIATPHFKKSYFNMSIHLTTPGYNYFRMSQPTGSFNNGSTSTTGLGSAGQNPQPAENSTDDAPSTREFEFGFDRQVRMEGSSFWNRPSKQHERALSDISDTRSTAHGRCYSGSSTMGTPNALPNNDIIDLADSRSKGYVFKSPWGGKCKFSTGGGGRTLRCKHTLPSPISASNTGESRFSSQPSVVVSELRFNLPSSAVLNAPPASDSTRKRGADSRRFSIPKFGHIRNKLSAHKTTPPLPPRPHPTSYAALYPSDEDEEPPQLPPRSHTTADSSDVEAPSATGRLHPSLYEPKFPDGAEDSRLDLRIGQENAGGGNRGKRAKYVFPPKPSLLLGHNSSSDARHCPATHCSV